MSRRRPSLSALATLLLTACSPDGPTEPLPPVTAAAIIDGANDGAVGGFFWLSPTVKKNQKNFTGAFDPNLLSVDLHIDVCEIDDSGPAALDACVGEILRTLNGGTPPEQIRVNVDTEDYSSTWQSTDADDFQVGSTYRAVVSVGSVGLGWVDLMAVADKKDVRRLAGNFAGFVPGDPFVFKFRVETGIVGQVTVTPPGAVIEETGTQVFTATVSDLYSTPLPGAAVDWAIDDAGVATLSPVSAATDGSGQTTTTATPAGTLDAVATVTVTSQGVSGTATLEVEPPPVPVEAIDDSYPEVVLGNVSVASANVSGGAFSVLDNDLGGASISVTPFTGKSLGGGDVTMTTDGRFTYDPPAGFEGFDTFEYTMSDGVTSDVGEVTLEVQDVIWFVDNTAAGPGDGRLSRPFNCLVSASCFSSLADDEPGDAIFLYTGSGSYGGGITLLAGQTLIGEGTSMPLASVAGVDWPTSSPPAPATGGSSPVITTTAPGTDAIRLATDNGLHGFEVAATTGSAIAGSGFGTLRVRDVDVMGDGQALDLTGGTLDAVGGFGELSSVNSAGAGISLVDILGGLSHTSASSITGATGVAFDVSGGTATITYGGDITNAAGRSVEVTGRTGGSASFGGSIDDDGAGVLLDGNGGSTIAFTGGLDLNTGANDAFTATGGGIVAVANQIVANRIVTSTGVGVRIENTTIGGAGVTFQSVSTDGAPFGIVLGGTGNSGAFRVSGTGAAGSGGSILNATVEGVRLTDANDVTLEYMTIGTPAPDADAVTASSVADLVFEGVSATAGTGASHALLGSNITNLTIANGTFDGGGGSVPNVHGVRLTNLFGTSLFTGSTFRNGKDMNVLIQNNTSSGRQDRLTVTDGTSFANSGGGDHLHVEADGVANMRLDVDNGGGSSVSFSGSGQDAIQLRGEGSATLVAAITQTTITGQLGAAVNMATSGFGLLHATVTGLDLTGGATHVVSGTAFDASTLEAIVTGNTITTPLTGYGVSLIQDGNGVVTANVSGNTISGASDGGLRAQARAGTNGLGTMNLTLAENVVAMSNPIGLDGITVQAGNSAGTDTNTVCLNMLNNSSTVAGSSEGYFLRNFSGATFRLQDFTGDGSSSADLTDWVTTVKGNTGTVFVSVIGPFAAAPAPCQTP